MIPTTSSRSSRSTAAALKGLGKAAGQKRYDLVPDLGPTSSRPDDPSGDEVTPILNSANAGNVDLVPVVPTSSRTKTNDFVPRPPIYRGTRTMSVTDGENSGSGPEVVHLTLRGYDPCDPNHLTQLAKLFASYLIEEFERTRTAPLGLPVALYLHTLTLWDGDGLVAFCSVDSDRCAVELVYVDPQYRHHGLAEDLYRRIKASCPIPLHVKGPLSPAGQALADRVGLSVDNCPDDEVAHAAQVDAELHRTMAASCKHKHGNPARGCNRCYRAAMRKTAVVLVGQHALAYQLLHEGRAFLL